MDGQAYSLPIYDQKSIREIEKLVDSGSITKDQAEEYKKFVEKKLKSLREIMTKEQSVGIKNPKLTEQFKHMNSILVKLNYKTS